MRRAFLTLAGASEARAARSAPGRFDRSPANRKAAAIAAAAETRGWDLRRMGRALLKPLLPHKRSLFIDKELTLLVSSVFRRDIGLAIFCLRQSRANERTRARARVPHMLARAGSSEAE